MDKDRKKKLLKLIEESAKQRKERMEGMRLSTQVAPNEKGKGSYDRKRKDYKKDF